MIDAPAKKRRTKNISGLTEKAAAVCAIAAIATTIIKVLSLPILKEKSQFWKQVKNKGQKVHGDKVKGDPSR